MKEKTLEEKLQEIIGTVMSGDYSCSNRPLGKYENWGNIAIWQKREKKYEGIDKGTVIEGERKDSRIKTRHSCQNAFCCEMLFNFSCYGFFEYYDIINSIAKINGVENILEVGVYFGASTFAAVCNNQHLITHWAVDLFESNNDETYKQIFDILNKNGENITVSDEVSKFFKEDGYDCVKIIKDNQLNIGNYQCIKDINFIIYDGCDNSVCTISNTFLSLIDKLQDRCIILIKKYQNPDIKEGFLEFIRSIEKEFEIKAIDLKEVVEGDIKSYKGILLESRCEKFFYVRWDCSQHKYIDTQEAPEDNKLETEIGLFILTRIIK